MIREFNEMLNSSTLMENRYRWFEAYRNKTTKKIVDIANKKNAKTMMVMAAGNMADIDYSKIVSNTGLKKIQLTDIDEAGLMEGYNYQALKRPRCEYKVVNYLGDKSEEETQVFVDAMWDLNNTIGTDTFTGTGIDTDADTGTGNKLTALVDTYIKQMCEGIISSDREKFDMVVIMPIYSQIVFLQLDEVLKECKRWQDCREYFFERMIYIIDAFNQKAITFVNEKGSLIVLSDIIEIPSKLTTLEERDTNLEAYIEKEIDAYEKTYGIGLGSYGLMNLEDYGDVCETYYFLWKFDDKRMFMVKGVWLNPSSNLKPQDYYPRR